MKIRKILMSTVVIGCMFAFAGCGSKMTAQSLLGDAQKATENVKSMECNMNMSMTVKSAGMSMDIGMDMDVQSVKEPAAAYMNGTVSVLGQELNMEGYTVTDGDKAMAYTSTMGMWAKQEVTVDQAQMGDVSAQIQSMLADKAEMTLAEKTETVDDKEVYVISTTLEGDIIKEVMGASQSLLSSATGGEADAEDEADYSGMSADVTYAINKETKQPVYMKLSITGMEAMFAGAEGTEDVSVPTCELTLTYTGFDTVDEIKVPQDVIDSAIDADDLAAALTGGTGETETDAATNSGAAVAANADGTYTLINTSDASKTYDLSFPAGMVIDEENATSDFLHAGNTFDSVNYFSIDPADEAEYSRISYIQAEKEDLDADTTTYSNVVLEDAQELTVGGYDMKAVAISLDMESQGATIIDYGFQIALSDGQLLEVNYTAMSTLGGISVDYQKVAEAIAAGLK